MGPVYFGYTFIFSFNPLNTLVISGLPQVNVFIALAHRLPVYAIYIRP